MHSATLAARPSVISFALGDPGDLVQQAHDVGSKVMIQITTVAQAIEAAERGADVIIAQQAKSLKDAFVVARARPEARMLFGLQY